MKKRLPLILFSFCIFTVEFVSAQIPSYVPTNGLVGWWPFNGNANDESGNGNNGIVSGTTSLTSDRKGNLNSAFVWDGTNSPISILSNMTQNFQSGITFSVWFYQTDMYCSNCSNTNYLTKGRNVNPGGIELGLDHSTQKFCFRVTGNPVSTSVSAP